MLLLVGVCLVGCTGKNTAPATILYRLTFETGDQDLWDALVTARLPRSPEVKAVLIETTGGRFTPVASQMDPRDESLLWFTADGELPHGSRRDYILVPADEAPSVTFSNVELFDDGRGGLLAHWGSRNILQYNYGFRLAEGMDPVQRRNAYIHPVWSPSGAVVTDDFHPDHAHQRGVWFAWTETRFRDRQPDFWNLHKQTGRVEFEAFGEQTEGPVFAEFSVRHRHLDVSVPDRPEVVLEEDWTVRVFRPGLRRPHTFDLTSVQEVVADAPLELQQYHYGGLGVRGARNWTPDKVTFLTSNGQQRPDADQTRVDWCLMEGSIPPNYAGLLALGHPDNFRAPQAVRIHPEMPYFSLTPLPLGSFEMRPKEKTIWRYRLIAYDGRMDSAPARQFWEEYCSPPAAQVELPSAE